MAATRSATGALRPDAATDAKTSAEVHGYHDVRTGVLAATLAGRAPGYTSLGFPDPRRIAPTAITDLTDDEVPLYVELAGLVDDGGASTIAAAIKRNWPLATDGRKARHVCTQRGLPEPAGTAALIRQYCDARALGQADIARLLGRIRNHASFQPPRSDPDLKWWTDHESGKSGHGPDT